MSLARGKPLGSYEMWSEWCRDPLLALGCLDPVERIEALKANDPRRQRIGELFRTWWEHHGVEVVKVNDLAEAVKRIANPHDRGRQYLATFISGLAGTRAAGFVLSRQEPAGKWNGATYMLAETERTDITGHRTHRPNGALAPSPMNPMGPMPDVSGSGAVPAGAEAEI
jgi:hypothetical protein